ncbi:MAG: UDP-4-amino-4,6-dideoxy-N-acetyl-beta-L-altrosamine transaminase [Candidatus Staskawiczbacteria bacterium]|nr:UDP-4-amino-4,6-dideoxy-N-acetyl-beta-L-altrosamine transaminase [Candidatus Staskawiczbacteria bacterium]
MIPYGHQKIDSDDINEVVKVLRSNWLTQGPKVDEFENKLAKYCGANYAVAVSNGTAALHLAYLASGLKKDDEVITTPNTFVATTNMLLAVGAKPVFCDIRSDTNNIDESKIEQLITPKTRVIVPVHFAGHPCEMKTIWKIAKKYNLLVIEDAAHALGARYRGKPIGGGQSDMCTLSFHPVKSITTGEGGAIITNNKKYYERLKLLRSHGIKKDKNGFNVMKEFGYNYRLSDLQAALGVSQLKKIEQFIEKRHELVSLYSKLLKDVDQIILPQELKDVKSSWHLYVVRVKDKKYRLPLYQYLLKNKIGVNLHYPCVYKHPYYKKMKIGAVCKIAENYSDTAITIPLHVVLSRKDINHVSSKIKAFFFR